MCLASCLPFGPCDSLHDCLWHCGSGIMQAYVAVDNNKPVDTDLIQKFKSHPAHTALAVCSSLRPPVDIAVTADADYVRKELRQ